MTAVPPAEALAYAEKALEAAPWTKLNVGLLAGVLSRQGQEQRARDLMSALDPGQFGIPVAFTIFHALRNEPEEAGAWLDRASTSATSSCR